MNIWLLIRKDFRANGITQLKALVILCALSAFFIYFWLNEGGDVDPGIVFYTLIVLLSSSMASILYMKTDDLNQMNKHFASLPVKRSEIVLARYASSYLLIVFALPAHFLGIQVAVLLWGEYHIGLNITNNPSFWISIYVALAFFKNLALPFYFKFGLNKGMIIYSFTMFMLLIGSMFSFQVFNPFYGIQQFGEWLSGQSIFAILSMGIALYLLLLAGSTSLSVKFYKNQEL